MKELEHDYFCSGFVPHGPSCECECVGCSNYHRKWPVVDLYRREYGRELPQDFPVWLLIQDDPDHNFHGWTLMEYAEALQHERDSEEADTPPTVHIVAACTPFEKPPKGWKREGR